MKPTATVIALVILAAGARAAHAQEPAAGAPPPATLSSFCKLDFPIGFTSTFTTAGIGLYPFSFGTFIRRASLMPYGSIGAAASVVQSGATGNPETSSKIIGAIVQPRIAVGAKYFPVRGLALTTEVDYSPWSVGILTLASPAGSTDSGARGGVGSVLDVSVGAEWL
jgi:hypothetical protein